MAGTGMAAVTSRDGTAIAYTRAGSGPAVILVGGGLDDGSENAPLVPELAGRLTVVNYARRGRGASGDTPPYALHREIEDLDALIGRVGGSAHLFGVSSGGALALEAVAAGLAVDRLAVFEVPYLTDEAVLRQWSSYVERLGEVLAEGRHGAAIELFMRLAGSSDQEIAAARGSSSWPGLEELAATLAYDAACLGDGRAPVARLATITAPTLVLTGRSAPDFYDPPADLLAAALPHARRRVLDVPSHVADPRVLGPVLAGFFLG